MPNVTSISQKRKSKKETAKYADYVQLATEILGKRYGLKRDIFSGHLCFYSASRELWLPVLNDLSLGMLQSKCYDSDGFFSAATVKSHMYRLTAEKTPEILIEILPWDGTDRLKVIAECIKCTNFHSGEIEELIKDWGAKMMRRMKDPIQQNRMLILKGPQGIGKDTLVKQMLGALGQYVVPFSICQQERDTYDQLISGMVMHIEEFDKTNRMEVAFLKYMITAERAYYRGAYDKVPSWKKIRNSFVATANIDALLRDHTGNRRYIIFDIESIEFRYPQGESMQILAQWQHLASSNTPIVSKETEEKLAAYIGQQTPPDPESEIVADYKYLWQNPPKADPKDAMSIPERHTDSFNQQYYLSSEMGPIWKELSRMQSSSLNWMRNVLKLRGYSMRGRDGTRYYLESNSQSEIQRLTQRDSVADTQHVHATDLSPLQADCDTVATEQGYVADDLQQEFPNDFNDQDPI